MSWGKILKGMSRGVVDKAKDFVTEDAWNLISDEGKVEVEECAAMMVEAQLLKAAGEDVDAIILAIEAAIGNWAMSGKIKMAQHTDEFLDELKDGLLIGLKAVMAIAIAAI